MSFVSHALSTTKFAPGASEVAFGSEVSAATEVKFAPRVAQVISNLGANLTSLCEHSEQNFTVSVANNFTTSVSE